MFILNFTFILYSLLFFALFLFLGLGLTVLFCPKEWLKYTIFLSPLIGYCLLTLAGWYFYILNFKGTDDYYYWILLLSLLLLIAAVFKIWKQKILKKLFSRELIIPGLIAIFVFLAIAMPSLRQEKMTGLVISNNDIAQYAIDSKIVKELPKDDPHYSLYGVNEPIMGGDMNTAFFCSVVKLDPYQVQNIRLDIFFIIALLLTYILGREVFHYTSFASNVIILLVGLNSVLYYVVYNGFLNQITAMSLMLLIMLSNVAIIRANRFKDAIRYLPFLFLALWCFSLTYAYMLFIIYGLITAYLLVSYWKNKKPATLLNWVAMNCIALAIILCLSPQRLQLIISNTIFFGTVVAGWPMPWINPQRLFGIGTYNYSTHDPLILTILAAVFLVVIIVSGFVKLHRSDKENLFFSSTTFLLILIGSLILSFLNITRGIGGFGGYNQFKLISFFFPLILLTSFALFGDMTFDIRSFNIRNWLTHVIKSSRDYLSIKRKTLYGIIIAGLVIANFLSAGITMYSTCKNSLVIPPDAIDLQAVRSNEEIKSINIPTDESGTFWNIMWEAYFLFPKQLFIEEKTYYALSPLNGEWSLVRDKGGVTENVLSVLPKTNPYTIQINSTYALIKGAPGLSAKFGEGWADNEGTHRWTIADTASIIINSSSDNIYINLALVYSPLNKDNSLSIYLSGNKIKDCDSNSSCFIKDLPLKKGENVIEFKAKLPPELPGNGDPRTLVYSFQLIQFEEVD
jgi:hypothetical protein